MMQEGGSYNNPRVSQRPSKSCFECKKRKVKCDKKIPCQHCVRQGIPQSCRVEDVQLSTKNTKSRDELTFLRQLLQTLGTSSANKTATDLIHRRIHFLETGREPDGPVESRTTLESLAGPQYGASLRGEDDTFVTATALIRLGRGYPDPVDLKSPEPNTSVLLSSPVSALLPQMEKAKCLVRYYINELAWHHLAIHCPEFFEQCEVFWSTEGYEDPFWLALYFSILSGASWVISAGACACGLHQDEGEARHMSLLYYEAMIKLLYDLDFMSNHSVCAIQAVITGTMIAHSLGKVKQHFVLLRACLRIAQCLGLSHQPPPRPQPSSDGDSRASWEMAVQREVVRRVWWQLLVHDYFLIPMAGAYGVSPDHFSTPLPQNCDDYDLEAKPFQEPTISSYCITLGRVALLIPELIDGLGTSRSPLSVEQQYRHVKHIDAKMRQLVLDLPPFLKPETEVDPSWPPWVRRARTAMTISAADKIIMIHRGFLIRSFQDPVTFAITRKTCVAAATTILNEFRRVKDSDMIKFWIVPSFAAAAAIILYLDIVCSVSANPSAVELLWDTIDCLKALSHDYNCRRGVYILEKLLEQKGVDDTRIRNDPGQMPEIDNFGWGEPIMEDVWTEEDPLAFHNSLSVTDYQFIESLLDTDFPDAFGVYGAGTLPY